MHPPPLWTSDYAAVPYGMIKGTTIARDNNQMNRVSL